MRSPPKCLTGVEQSIFHVGRLSEFLGVGEAGFHVLDELQRDTELIDMLERSVASEDDWQTKAFGGVYNLRLFRIVMYVAARLQKPHRAIETGVLHGLTSAFILRALEINRKGKLLSVDLPSYPATGPANNDGYVATLPAGRQPGWIVPSQLAANWDLVLKSSFDALTELDGMNDLGFFLHDSEHTYETMMFELGWAWRNLSEGGLLFCDNIDANTAFEDFVGTIERDAILFPAPDESFSGQLRFGMVVK